MGIETQRSIPNGWSVPAQVTPASSAASPQVLNAGCVAPMSLPSAESQDKVFIGGLPGDITEDYVRGLVALIGGVTSIKVWRKDDRAPLCAFVTFQFVEQGQRCIDALNESENGASAGRRLAVRWANPPGEQRKRAAPVEAAAAPPLQRMAMTPPLNMPAAQAFTPWTHADSTSSLPGQQVSLVQMPMQMQQIAVPGTSSAVPCSAIPCSTVPCLGVPGPLLPEKVFVGSLPTNVSEHELQALFDTYGQVLSLRVLHGQRGPPYALVQYGTQLEAEHAIATLTGYTAFDDKPLVVRFAKPATRGNNTMFS